MYVYKVYVLAPPSGWFALLLLLHSFDFDAVVFVVVVVVVSVDSNVGGSGGGVDDDADVVVIDARDYDALPPIRLWSRRTCAYAF